MIKLTSDEMQSFHVIWDFLRQKHAKQDAQKKPSVACSKNTSLTDEI